MRQLKRKQPVVTPRRRKRKPHLKPGVAPGSLVIDPDAPEPVIRVIAYNETEYVEETVAHPEDLPAYLETWPVVWINVDGLGDAQTLSKISEQFHIHALAMEDVVNVNQRPKLEAYGDQQFIILRMPMKDHHGRLDSQQLSIFLDQKFVLTFQEQKNSFFEPVRQRIREHSGNVHTMGVDYLGYALLDALIDSYFPMLEKYGTKLEDLEDDLHLSADRRMLTRLHDLKRDLLTLRRDIWPLREVLNSLVRDPISIISDKTRIYLRDCYDHTIQVIDLLETYRELCGGLMDLYLSSLSHKMNEVMKVLTIIATIFIPLSFIAGLYGMNFDYELSPLNMPELHWYWGYPFALTMMALIAIGMLILFWRKGWLTPAPTAPVHRDDP